MTKQENKKLQNNSIDDGSLQGVSGGCGGGKEAPPTHCPFCHHSLTPQFIEPFTFVTNNNPKSTTKGWHITCTSLACDQAAGSYKGRPITVWFRSADTPVSYASYGYVDGTINSMYELPAEGYNTYSG